MTSDDDTQAWVRDVLASLDRPAIPAQVAERIDEAIAAANVPLPRRPQTPSVTVPQQSGGPDRRTPNTRRRSWLLGAAGAAAALIVVATIGPFGSQPPPPSASGTGQAAAPEATGASPSPSVGLGSPAEVDPEPGVGVAEVSEVLMASQTAYRAQTLPEQVLAVSQLRTAAPQPSNLPTPWTAVAEQPAATARGAADCVAALPPPTEELLYVDRAEYEGQPVLVVALRAASQVEVYVLAAGCTAADTRVLLRATVEAP